jgi:hypothetical protein
MSGLVPGILARTRFILACGRMLRIRLGMAGTCPAMTTFTGQPTV